MTGHWPAKRLLVATVAILLLVTASAVAAAAFALGTLSENRIQAVDRAEPALQYAKDLSRALLDQETGVRGYALTGEATFLQPYLDGQRLQRDAAAGVRGLVGDPHGALRRVEELAESWRAEYAEPTIARVRATGTGRGGDEDQARARFEEIRAALDTVQREVDAIGLSARVSLDQAASGVLWLAIGMGAFLVALISAVALVLYRILVTPLASLAEQVRLVASGEFTHEIDALGPREMVMLGTDVNAMRRRIVHELSNLEGSNAELERFAYVASHDLQEPLRKIASFCQLLQRRYGGQLDEPADQYIEFAVDGAKRMQVLINDLLSFSRVGRLTGEHTLVDTGFLVRQVIDNYSERIAETGASITVADLPRVRGEESLLSTVFGNLISNALKFHGPEPPRITIGVRRTGDFWTFSCHDNGIGIDPEYAERIFVIFQRLHPKDAYPGTGIGLAMCRKIVEHHGGTIQLKTGEGTTFEFTLPVAEESDG